MNVYARKIACLFVLTFLVSVSFSSIASAQYYPISWDTLTVTVNLAGAGTVTSWIGQYSYGSSIVVTEQTNLGYSFNGWYLNGVYQGQLSSILLTMTQNYNFEAIFSAHVVALTIIANPANGGTIAPGTGIWNYSTCASVVVPRFPKSTVLHFSGCILMEPRGS